MRIGSGCCTWRRFVTGAALDGAGFALPQRFRLVVAGRHQRSVLFRRDRCRVSGGIPIKPWILIMAYGHVRNSNTSTGRSSSILDKFRVANFPITSKSSVRWIRYKQLKYKARKASPFYTTTAPGLCIPQQALSARNHFQFPTILQK